MTPMLAMTQSFEDCDWLVVQEENKRALLGSIISLHFEMTYIIFSCFTVLSLTHTHTHTHYICICNLYFLLTMLSYLTYFIRNEQLNYKCSNRPKSSLLHSCIFPVAKYVTLVITSISGAMAFQRSVSDVSMSLI